MHVDWFVSNRSQIRVLLVCGVCPCAAGVHTSDIITVYISAIKALRDLDPSMVILQVACQPIRKYLRSVFYSPSFLNLIVFFSCGTAGHMNKQILILIYLGRVNGVIHWGSPFMSTLKFKPIKPNTANPLCIVISTQDRIYMSLIVENNCVSPPLPPSPGPGRTR